MRARKHLRAFGAIALALAALTASAVVVFSPSDAAQLATTAGPSTTDTMPDQSDTSAPPPATESVIEDERPLVVEPSEGLRDGQPLRVRIRRPPARILVDICVTGDDSGCAFFPATTRTSATFTETASRFIVTKSGAIVDCAERAGRCVLRVYDVAEIPLTFDATEPAPQFGYSADRTTQLRGRHSIRLSGTTPSRFVTLAQCFATAPSPSCVPLRGLAVVPGRAFAGDVVVTRALMSGDGTFDCALQHCELRVSGNVPQHPVLARFPLEFATDEPLALPYLHVEDGPTSPGQSPCAAPNSAPVQC